MQPENFALSISPFSEKEQQALLIKAWELWKKQAQKYGGLDNTSITIERAQALLMSALYTVSVASNGQAPRGDFEALLTTGQSILRQKLADTKVEWKKLKACMPAVQNIYYHHTIANISEFFKKYDVYYEAQMIPCDISYWPMCPVPEELLGISFMEEYIRRIRWETDFVRAFPEERVRCLYQCYVPNYQDMLFNLCEPVLCNAIGLALLRKNYFDISVNSKIQQDILHILRGKSQEEMHELVSGAITFICRSAGIRDSAARKYFLESGEQIIPRLFSAVSSGNISRVFLNLKT